ncbi:hypothetical protein GX51_06392 [Blastomyces parvus]|uniref:Rhodanese domain-containing protein n=1 Tax=Blastomyces parvus TaxID=2060905 RepID=A0A2B7WRJ6_9EURO|nr:hypothetical protein GX51_06392 [Blastomyces parvus]
MPVAVTTARALSSSAPRLTCQFLRTRTGGRASSRTIAAGVARGQAVAGQGPLWLGGGVVRCWGDGGLYAGGARWFSAGGVWRQNANAPGNANGNGNGEKQSETEFKTYGFEEITASLPSSHTSSSPSSRPAPILIDVREPTELTSTGIIPTAHHIPIRTHPDAFFLPPDEFLTRFGFAKPEADAPPSSTTATKEEKPDIIFYCKAGVRARSMAKLAAQAGYDKGRLGVYYGSWLDWEKRGGPVERWEGKGDGE